MTTQYIDPGDLVSMDPDDIRVFQFDWSTNLSDTASIVTSTFVITAIRPKGNTSLSQDEDDILLVGSPERATSTEVRLTAASCPVGALYEIANLIVTDETPPQTKERSFRLLIEER